MKYFFSTLIITIFFNICLGQANNGEKKTLDENLVLDVIKKAIVTGEDIRVFSGIRKPSYIFQSGNKVHDDYANYFHDCDVDYLLSQYKNQILRELSKGDFDKKNNVDVTNKEVMGRFSGDTYYISHPMFSQDMKTSVIYYEKWSRSITGELQGKAIYKVFKDYGEQEEHILQATMEIQ